MKPDCVSNVSSVTRVSFVSGVFALFLAILLIIENTPVYAYDTLRARQNEINAEKEAEFNLLCNLVAAEARGESEYGQRLVADCVLNRVDSENFPDTIEGVIYDPHQFEPVSRGSINNIEASQQLRIVVFQELIHRTNYDVVYFRTKYYHSCGRPLFVEGNHFFSGL